MFLGVVALLLPLGVANLDRIRDDQWHLRYLQTSDAHAHSQGEGQIVAVIDTGVEPHPDLQANLMPGIDLMSDLRDGRRDTDSHGTGMAGLIAAHGKGRNDGALGLAPRAKILPIRDRISLAVEGGDLLAAGIEWALRQGADIISISSGGSPTARLRKAIEAATREDIVVVASAGNRPGTQAVTFPAAYDGVLAVGATDRQGNHADVSVTGKQVAISAPGVDIYSTSYNGQYRKGTGTSDAAAIVSGAVALVRSKFPGLSAQEVIHRLTATATDKGPPGRDEQYGYGVLNLVAALTADVPPLGAGTTTTPATSAAAVPPDEPGRGGAIGIWVALMGATGVGVAAMVLGARRRRRAKG